jgi:hypothetical protein
MQNGAEKALFRTGAVHHLEHEPRYLAIRNRVAVGVPSACRACAHADRAIRKVCDCVVGDRQPRVVSCVDSNGTCVLLARVGDDAVSHLQKRISPPINELPFYVRPEPVLANVRFLV